MIFLNKVVWPSNLSNNSNINSTGPDDQVVPAVGEHMSLVSAKQGIQGALIDANLALALA